VNCTGVVVVIVVGVVRRANVMHLVSGTTLHAARLGLIARECDPEDTVRVDGEAGAADVLLIAGRIDDDGVLWGACISLASPNISQQ
jgi:hypothetical protein